MENKMSKNFADKLTALMPKDTESLIQTSLAVGDIDEEMEGGVGDDITLEGLANRHGVTISHIVNQLSKGIRVEMEHTERALDALDIAIDHIFEDPNYYTKLKKMETKEATSSSSSGSYESPSFLAKSTSKKDWRGASKTQIPGGKFVSIKKKCNRFPYCNQGDINALNLYENPSVRKAISNISKKYGITENVIKSIIQHEYENIQSKDKK